SALGIETTWDLSLKMLLEQSVGAYRLLLLFSVLAPEISLSVIYSDEIAAVLRPFDKSVVDRYVRGSVVQPINRIGLLPLDLAGGQIRVQPLVQRVLLDRIPPDDLRELRHQAHLVLAGLATDQDVDDAASWSQFAIIWPHLDASHAMTC